MLIFSQSLAENQHLKLNALHKWFSYSNLSQMFFMNPPKWGDWHNNVLYYSCHPRIFLNFSKKNPWCTTTLVDYLKKDLSKSNCWSCNLMSWPHTTHRKLSFDYWIFEFDFCISHNLAYEIIANFSCVFNTK